MRWTDTDGKKEQTFNLILQANTEKPHGSVHVAFSPKTFFRSDIYPHNLTVRGLVYCHVIVNGHTDVSMHGMSLHMLKFRTSHYCRLVSLNVK